MFPTHRVVGAEDDWCSQSFCELHIACALASDPERYFVPSVSQSMHHKMTVDVELTELRASLPPCPTKSVHTMRLGVTLQFPVKLDENHVGRPVSLSRTGPVDETYLFDARSVSSTECH